MTLTDNGATKSLGRIVATLLSGSWRAVPHDPNISAEELRLVAPLLLQSGSAALAWWRIHDSRLSECDAAIELRSAYQLHSLQAAIHRTEIEEIISRLNSAGVDPVLVKGWAVARLYPEQGLRPYGDIDLCFGPDQHQKALAVLTSPDAGKYSVDVHSGFGKLDDLRLDELMASSEPARLGAAHFRVLGAEDQLRILCTHLLRHSAWRPLWLCDIAAAVESRSASFDWDRCLGSDRRQADWVACAIGLAHQLLAARVDDTPASQRAKQLPRWLIPAVMKNWNQPFPDQYPPLSYLPPMATYLRHPAGVLKAIRKRWPDPIEATIRLRGSFNEMPRMPYQIGNAFLRIVRFLTRTQ
jgi:putative nucleotidyltransferase-like protein